MNDTSQLPLVQPLSAARSIAALLGAARDLLDDAKGVAKDGQLSQLPGWIAAQADALDTLLSEVRELIATLEAEART
jgi:hypothetical protein